MAPFPAGGGGVLGLLLLLLHQGGAGASRETPEEAGTGGRQAVAEAEVRQAAGREQELVGRAGKQGLIVLARSF